MFLSLESEGGLVDSIPDGLRYMESIREPSFLRARKFVKTNV